MITTIGNRKTLLKFGLLLLVVVALAGGMYLLMQGDARLPVEFHAWQFFAVFVTMLLINVAVLFVLITVIRWKSTVQNGMMAVVPSEVIDSSNAARKSTNQMVGFVNSAFSEITKHLKNTADSVHILKHELKLKEDELALLKNGAARLEKEKVTNKLAKIHSFLRKLETEVDENRMDASAAIKFLNNELEDLFDEFGIFELKVSEGDRIAELGSDSFAIKSYELTIDENQNMTVALVLERGYGATSSNGIRRIVKPSVIIVKKLGE